jgi:hypothetical protein
MQQGTIRAIETGGWAVGVGVLEYVTTSTEVEHWLQQLVPHPLVPLVAIVLGGAALAVRVYRHGNAASEPAPSLDAPAPAEQQTVRPPRGRRLRRRPRPPPRLRHPDAATEAAQRWHRSCPSCATRPRCGVAASVGTPAPAAQPLQWLPEPAAPPTSFIPLPTR